MSSRRLHGAARESAARATAVLLEDIRSQNKVVLEAVQGLGEKLEQLRLELCERIARVEDHVGRVEERVGRVEDAVRENSREIRAVKKALSAKVDAAVLAALELRVAALERKVGR
jgi:predicted  nucleic acid-binding Zn-ribbon protein